MEACGSGQCHSGAAIARALRHWCNVNVQFTEAEATNATLGEPATNCYPGLSHGFDAKEPLERPSRCYPSAACYSPSTL